MKNNCEDFTEEEKAVSMRYNIPQGPNISQEARAWLEQARRELSNQDRQLRFLYDICYKLCKDVEMNGDNGIEKIRNCYVLHMSDYYSDATEEMMYWLPNEFLHEHREQTGQL